MKRIDLFEINQPIGTFYMGKMLASDLISIKIVKRIQDGNGVQRLLKHNRVKSIAVFCNDPDATFPTPIILAVNSENMLLVNNLKGIKTFEYEENQKIAEILDGQHRIEGIELSALDSIEIPIIIMFDLTEEQKAYVFSTINGNQERVNPSVIYELFGLSRNRSPYKTCHEIARALNSNESSPFYRRLKMLEKRECSTETISQNVFVKGLCRLITKYPQEDAIRIKKGEKIIANESLAFSRLFVNEKDEIILKVLLNYFTAAQKVFYTEWNDPTNYILTKTVGFEALIEALNKLVPFGEAEGDLSEGYFERIFLSVKENLITAGIVLNSSNFPSNAAGKKSLSTLIIKAKGKKPKSL